MTQPFEDFLVELAVKGDLTVLGRLPNYLDGHYVAIPDIPAERNRLIVAFRDRAPQSELSVQMLDIISQDGLH